MEDFGKGGAFVPDGSGGLGGAICDVALGESL